MYDVFQGIHGSFINETRYSGSSFELAFQSEVEEISNQSSFSRSASKIITLVFLLLIFGRLFTLNFLSSSNCAVVSMASLFINNHFKFTFINGAIHLLFITKHYAEKTSSRSISSSGRVTGVSLSVRTNGFAWISN